MDNEGIVSLDDAAKIGLRIVEMADRVKVGSKYMPNAETKWWFEVDGARFAVTVTLSEAEEGQQYGTYEGKHRPLEPHDWKPQFNRDTGEPDRPRCRRCRALGPRPQEGE